MGMNISNDRGNKTPLWALVLLSFIAVIVFRDYLMFRHIFFFRGVGSDTFNAYYPFYVNVCSYIAKYGVPKWSFNYGMGQSIFPFFLRDPFDIFLYPGGKDFTIYGIAYKEVVKIVLSGLVFFYYLRALKLSDYTSVVGSLLFAFCGFMTVGCCWYMFSFDGFNVALLLLSFELLFNKQRLYLFPLAVALICIAQPFNLYLDSVFISSYAILRHIQTGKFNIKSVTTVFLKITALGITGMLLSAPFLVQNIIQLVNSPRVSGGNSYAHTLSSSPVFAIADKLQLGTGFMRFFSNDILGTGLEFRGWHNFLEAPLFYCGLPCLLLLPQLFPFLEKRLRIVFIIFIGIWILPVVFPYFRYAFWLFTGSYYRAYSFFVAFFVLYYSLQALELVIKKRKINLPILVVTVIVLSGLLHYPFFADKRIPVASVVMFTNVMFIGYAVVLYLMTKSNAALYKYIFMGMLVCELIHLSRITVNNMDAFPTSDLAYKGGYNDYTVEALRYIKTKDSAFYRVDKTYSSSYTYFPTFNDGMAQGYRGTTEYSSFNQKYYILYLQLMGIADKNKEDESRWGVGLINRPILESENRVKYILTGDEMSAFRKETCDSLTSINGLKVLRNRYVLPLGYTYHYYIKENVFDKLTNEQKDLVSMHACVLKDGDINNAAGMVEFQLKDTLAVNLFSNDIYKKLTDSLSKDTLVVGKFDDNLIRGNINLSEDKMMYLSVPYDMGWQLAVDGHEQDKIILDGGMTGVYLHKGPHTVQLSFELPFIKISLMLSLAGLLLYGGILVYNRKLKERSYR